MNKLEEIGFYTLSNERANNTSISSDLQRCELILTRKCNFKCPYCRGIDSRYQTEISFEDAKYIVDLWANDNLHNIRLSGGEPSLVSYIIELVKYIKSRGCYDHIAISTNGSNDISLYKKLIKVGVNDFSISLDACCSATGDTMSGTSCEYEKVIFNIRELSKLTYVSVGVVLDENNFQELEETINLADSLGVSDIRIIPSAQWDNSLHVKNITDDVLDRNKILKYRINNIRAGKHVRGISKMDSSTCYLCLDDMAVMGGFHFPCIIYMRENGDPIGTIKEKSIRQIRFERFKWMLKHNSFNDPICRKNCLDVCVEYNNKVKELREPDKS